MLQYRRFLYTTLWYFCQDEKQKKRKNNPRKVSSGLAPEAGKGVSKKEKIERDVTGRMLMVLLAGGEFFNPGTDLITHSPEGRQFFFSNALHRSRAFRAHVNRLDAPEENSGTPEGEYLCQSPHLGKISEI